MSVTSGGPHLLLFERDQQLVSLLASELALAGYEVHTARTAVEVFDAIARFSVRLVMVNLAQAQAGRREFWVALDAQRRGRGVQVFTYRCTNLAGYGPDDPDERVDTVMSDLEVDGMRGIAQLVEAVRVRVAGGNAATPIAMPPPVASAPPIYRRETSPQYEREKLPPFEMPSASSGSGIYRQEQLRGPEQLPPFEMPAAPMVTPPLSPASYPAVQRPLTSPMPSPGAQQFQGVPRPQPPQEMYAAPPPSPRPMEPQPQAPRSTLSTFTDKIRAVIYPGGRHTASAPEVSRQVYQPDIQPQSPVQPRPQAPQRAADASYTSHAYREDISYQAPAPPPPPSAQAYSSYTGSSTDPVPEESGLDQLSRLLHNNQYAAPNTPVHGNMQNGATYATDIEQQELQTLRAQILRSAQLDEAYERAQAQAHPTQVSGLGAQLRASPMQQEMPPEREAEYRRNASGLLPQTSERAARPAMTILQPTQSIPPVQPAPPAAQASPAQHYQAPTQQTAPRPGVSPETPSLPGNSAPIRATISYPEMNGQARQSTNPLGMSGASIAAESPRTDPPTQPPRRLEIKASDDLLLDIVKSLPPMAPATPVPAPEPPPVLNGRATRSLGSVLLEGHLVPEERLQVAQHVQRMMRGVDLNYQLGEILLMFKLLTPDQLLAASLVSYNMVSTTQISALGRIRQELHAMGLEYDLESLVILFRLLTPEQLREVRASWAS